MNTKTLRKIIETTNGQVFTVWFTKKDGTQRQMNCRTGVQRHLKGGASTTAHKPNLLTVYDMQSGGYRCINLETVHHLRIGGVDMVADVSSISVAFYV